MLNSFLTNQIVLNGSIVTTSGVVVLPSTPSFGPRIQGDVKSVVISGESRTLKQTSDSKTTIIEGNSISVHISSDIRSPSIEGRVQ